MPSNLTYALTQPASPRRLRARAIMQQTPGARRTGRSLWHGTARSSTSGGRSSGATMSMEATGQLEGGATHLGYLYGPSHSLGARPAAKRGCIAVLELLRPRQLLQRPGQGERARTGAGGGTCRRRD